MHTAMHTARHTAQADQGSTHDQGLAPGRDPEIGAGTRESAPGAWWLAVIVVVLGLGGGALTQVAQGVLDDPWAAWANSIAAWCLPAFVVGALAVRRGRATAAGVVTLLLLVIGYYAMRLVADDIELPPERTLLVWTLGAVAGGVVFGLAGAWWRAADVRLQVLGAALISAVLVGEGIQRQVMFPWQGNSGLIMVGAGIVLAFALARSTRQKALIPLLAAAVVPLGLAGIWLTNYLINPL